MINQVLISARIDNAILWKIEQETLLGDYKRNRILNEGASMFVELLDRRRLMRIHPDIESRMKLLDGFVKLYIPECKDLTGVENLYK